MKRNFIATSIIAAALTLAGAFSANAQSFLDNLSGEATIGVNISNYHNGDDSNPKGAGFRVGVIGQYSIPQVSGLYANAGLLLSLEGSQYKNETTILGVTTKTKATNSPWFLNIPIHAGYQLGITDDIAAFVEAGPFVGIGLFGNSVVKTTVSDKENNVSNPVFGDEYSMNRFQFGLGIKLGVLAFQNYKVSFGWDWNFVDVLPKVDNAQSHNCGYISLSYAF